MKIIEIIVDPGFYWDLITNFYPFLIPLDKLLQPGHKSLKDFYMYIKVTPDQAAYQIEKIWKENQKIRQLQSFLK